MKLIELESDGRVFLINPSQITHVEGHESDLESAIINISLNAIDSSGKSVILTFRHQEALDLFKTLRSPTI